MKIRIPKPCHENWEKMIPEEKGRFCQSCQKVVVDFSQMSDSELYSYLQTHSQKNICGNFKKTQLNREFHWAKPSPLCGWYKQAAALLVSALMLGTYSASYSQHKIGKMVASPHSVKINSNNETVINENIFKGTIVNQDSRPISDALIYVKNTNQTCHTDAAGHFKIPSTRDNLRKSTLIVEVVHSDYDRAEFALTPNRQAIYVLHRRQDEIEKGEVLIEE